MIRKTQSHGRIGEAAVLAKCWMNGCPAYSTGGLRANFARSDLIVDTEDPRKKLWIQVKTGDSPSGPQIYLTQCAGECDLVEDKFAADFVVFVNIDQKIGMKHQHDGTLGFEHLTFYVVPRDDANRIYREAVVREHNRPLKTGGQRKLGNLAVIVPSAELQQYKDAWVLLHEKIT
jgi:hypothetical protein